MVDAIVQAGLLILREEGADKLTTKRIAERAGVSIGSLYQYFVDKEDVVESVYREQHSEFWDAAVRWVPKLAARPLEEAIALIVDAGIQRHRRLHDLHPDFYPDHAVRYTLSTFNPEGRDRASEWVKMILECHRDRLAVSPDRGAFLLTRTLGGIFISVTRERSHMLGEPALREELIRMLLALVATPDRAET